MIDSTKEQAEKLAIEYIVKHNYDYTTLNKNYGGGISANNVNFGYCLADASANEVVNELKKSSDPKNDFKNIIKHFAQVVLAFNPSEFAYSLDSLKRKIEKNCPDLVENSILSSHAQKDIIDSLKKNENCTASKLDVISYLYEEEKDKKIIPFKKLKT